MAQGETTSKGDVLAERARLTSDLNRFARGLLDDITKEIERQTAARTKKIRKRNRTLEEQAVEAKRLAESRREELNGHLNRARNAEAHVKELKKKAAEQAVTIEALQEKLAGTGKPEMTNAAQTRSSV
ncbi:hypothetical protein LCGC14_1356160 [marine sediment metagenome]|uniref:Uncharacterized protein n=1 Tax=marine sediment metagenome TaxID=412755 RepID=A0A0F9KVQ5_9ZZZZ